jgi:hypothetical protein
MTVIIFVFHFYSRTLLIQVLHSNKLFLPRQDFTSLNKVDDLHHIQIQSKHGHGSARFDNTRILERNPL